MWPLLSPRCTCVSALVLSQYQQAVFHHSVREAHGIRAESTQNNYTELRDNTEPKHQRETGGHCFVHHPAGIRPKEKQCVAIVEVHWHTHTHTHKKIEQDVMSFCAWGHRWPTVSPACECASATAIRRAHLIFETRWHRGLRAALLYIMSPITITVMNRLLLPNNGAVATTAAEVEYIRPEMLRICIVWLPVVLLHCCWSFSGENTVIFCVVF